jgi:hypothetical protein
MARIRYDEQTAAAFKAVREVPRDGLAEWREAIARHLRASPGMKLLEARHAQVDGFGHSHLLSFHQRADAKPA